jgi:hypothetical protein
MKTSSMSEKTGKNAPYLLVPENVGITTFLESVEPGHELKHRFSA